MDAVVTDSTKSHQITRHGGQAVDLEDETGTPLFFLETDAADIRSFIDGCLGRRIDPGSGD